ncbi:MAG TPA: ABC transporter ATP-binding protein [Casimicrobiaceae bacterium]|nr:ABC transporter ATP-binding protein [Casimicrobiaceae bacterium]
MMSVTHDATPKLAVRGVTQTFVIDDAREPLVALDNIDLAIPRGRFVCLIGESGCGKSTLLRIMAGLLEPSAGEVLHDGKAVRGVNQALGFVFQQDAVFPWLTVEKNVAYGPRSRGVPAPERERLVDHWCRAVGLEAFRKAYPKQLSGGMRKRVDLARAYANSPDVLLMDEPFAALDVQTKASMQEAVLGLWESTQKTVVFVTHDLDEAVFLSDVVVVLASRPGRVHATIDNPLARPRNEATRMSDAFAAAKRELWNAMQAARTANITPAAAARAGSAEAPPHPHTSPRSRVAS